MFVLNKISTVFQDCCWCITASKVVLDHRADMCLSQHLQWEGFGAALGRLPCSLLRAEAMVQYLVGCCPLLGRRTECCHVGGLITINSLFCSSLVL